MRTHKRELHGYSFVLMPDNLLNVTSWHYFDSVAIQSSCIAERSLLQKKNIIDFRSTWKYFFSTLISMLKMKIKRRDDNRDMEQSVKMVRNWKKSVIFESLSRMWVPVTVIRPKNCESFSSKPLGKILEENTIFFCLHPQFLCQEPKIPGFD